MLVNVRKHWRRAVCVACMVYTLQAVARDDEDPPPGIRQMVVELGAASSRDRKQAFARATELDAASLRALIRALRDSGDPELAAQAGKLVAILDRKANQVNGRDNVALHKACSGPDGAGSNNKAFSWKLTDGDLDTEAKPPASSFQYTIDLQQFQEGGQRIEDRFDLRDIVIHWGIYGTPYIPDGGGQAAYITGYRVEYRTETDGQWQLIHDFNGAPVGETTADVMVTLEPLDNPNHAGKVRTWLQNLHIDGAIQLRLTGRGGMHWIGCFEFSAYGETASVKSRMRSNENGM